MSTHATTIKAQRRERDRVRKQKKRAAAKALRRPEPHQVDNAICEALSFVLASSLESISGKLPDDATISFKRVFRTAFNILTQRWRFDEKQSKDALNARLAKRQEHSNPNWTPHFPSCEPQYWADLPTVEFLCTPVTSSGHVQELSPSDSP